MKYLVINSSNMIGHVVALYLLEQGNEVVGYDEKVFEGISTILGTLYNINYLTDIIQKENFDAVINCSAIINQYAEENKADAVYINSYIPHLLEKITSDLSTVVVHRSTDCIFSGLRGSYLLNDVPDANSFYAKTKTVGEIWNKKDITIRTSLVGPEIDIDGDGLFNWFFYQSKINGFANTIWTGLTTIEFAKQIDWLLLNGQHGVFQLVPKYAISKYELLMLFEKYYPGNRIIIREENIRVDKSLIPNIENIKVEGYEQQIKEMREWTDSHPELYRYK